MTKPGTHFEQIPVELVKKFAKAEDMEFEELVKEEEHADGHAAAANPANFVHDSPFKKTEPYSVRPEKLTEKRP